VQAESIESSPQQPLHRHRTHLHLLPETAIAPPRQHHLPDHEPLARFQHRQHRFHLRGSPRFVLGWVRAGSGHEFQLIRGQGTGPSQLSLLLQGVPLLAAHAQLAPQLRRGGRAGHPLLVLPFETGKLFLQLRLATGQPNAGRGIPQVVKDRTADVGSGERLERDGAIPAVQLGGADQPQQPDLGEILTGFTAAAAVVEGDRPDQLAVGLDPQIALSQSLVGQR
jgi:hypothetical protein